MFFIAITPDGTQAYATNAIDTISVIHLQALPPAISETTSTAFHKEPSISCTKTFATLG